MIIFYADIDPVSITDLGGWDSVNNPRFLPAIICLCLNMTIDAKFGEYTQQYHRLSLLIQRLKCRLHTATPRPPFYRDIELTVIIRFQNLRSIGFVINTLFPDKEKAMRTKKFVEALWKSYLEYVVCNQL